MRVVPAGAGGTSWDAVAFRGAALEPPVRVELDSDETVGRYLDAVAARAGRSATVDRAALLELAMMRLVEGLETTDASGSPALAVIGFREGPGGQVGWFEERRPLPRPPAPDGDLEWRAGTR